MPSVTPGKRPPGAAGLLLAVMLVPAMLLSGCARVEEPKTYPVRGRVTYRGRPVTGGLILLVPQEQGHAATGELQADGTFRLTTFRRHDGAVPGKYRVAVQVFPTESAGLPGAEFGGKRPPIPQKYFDPATSGWIVDIQSGENTLDISLAD